MKRFVSFRQQAVNLARGDVDSQVQQFFADQRLRDEVLVMLIDDVAPQRGPEMPADVRGQRGRSARPVGQKIAQTPIEDIVGLDPQILNHEVLVAVLRRARRKPLDGDRDYFVNGQFPGLLALGRAGPLAPTPLLVRWIGMRRVKRTRADCRPPRQSLQAVDLLTQAVDFRLLLGNHPHQALHEGGPLLRRQLDARNLDRLGSLHALQETPKLPSR